MTKRLDRSRTLRRRGWTACATLAAIVLLGAGAAASGLARNPASAGDADRSAMPPQASTTIAQAGSSGGSVTPPGDIGKTRKSISGGEPRVQPAPAVTPKPSAGERTRRATHRRATGARRGAVAARRCPNIAGVWSSWASGLMGKNDTTFYANGTGVHRTGLKARWWCDNGQLHIEWPDGRPGPVEVSPDGRTITAGGKLHMRRE